MRQSILSRSMIAAVSLAVAAVTLNAVPATAATASGITRDQVLAAATAVRLDGPATEASHSPSTTRILRGLANRACAVDHDSEVVETVGGLPVQGDNDVDGLMAMALIVDQTPDDDQDPDDLIRACIFGALASTDPAFSLTGTATLGYLTSSTHELSGDVYVTPARNLKFRELIALGEGADAVLPSFSASGNASKTTSTTTATNVSTPKTTRQKKAAKKAYDKVLKSAKKSYTKAAKKARKNKSKKAAAKKSYAKKTAAAQATYRKAIAPTVTTVNRTTSNSENRPFSVSMLLPEISEEVITSLD